MLAVDHDDHADATVKDAVHFAFGDLAFVLQPLKKLRASPRGGIDHRLDRGGQDARYVFGQAAAGDMRHAFDRQGFHQGQQGLDVDVRRAEQGVGERSRLCAVCVKSSAQVGLRAR